MSCPGRTSCDAVCGVQDGVCLAWLPVLVMLMMECFVWLPILVMLKMILSCLAPSFCDAEDDMVLSGSQFL